MTTTLSFPACAASIGEALDPQNPVAGLTKAVAIVGEARVRSIAETLLTFNGCPVNQVLSTLSASWHTKHAMAPAIQYLRELGPTAVMSAMAARLFAKTDGGFNVAALDAIVPGVRVLSGLPSRSEVEAALRPTGP